MKVVRVAEMEPLLDVPLEAWRGPSLARHPSSGAARHRSQDALTPLESPLLSPTTVRPPSPRSKRSEAWSDSLMPAAPSQALLQLCAPPSMLLSVSSPSRPPGFKASLMPPPPSNRPVSRQPSPVRCRSVDAFGAVGLQCLPPLFEDCVEAILPTPALTPFLSRALTTCQKTLAGVFISRVGDGLLLHKTKASSCPKASSVAHAAELLVCRSCNIAKDGEGVTAAALDAFTDRFKEHMSL
ncbi:hypothetical protein ZWY2020_028194 [Hordeum vulgare]|nr:hypothetical protein ZWY2020_028194 [Hordeum vulgare]